MNIVFVHDHKFREVNGEYYSPGGLPNGILTRYTDWFGRITVIGRKIKEDIIQPTYSKISNSDVTVVTNENLELLVKKSDATIARLPSINGFKAIHYAKKYNKPYLVEVVGCTFDAYWNYGLKGKIVAIPAYMIMRHYIKNAPYALYVTSEFLQRRYPNNGKTIGVSDVAIESSDKTILEKRIKKIRNNKNIIVLGTAAAVDVGYKGQEFVIKAIPDIMKAIGKDVFYELCGAGDPQRLTNIAREYGVSENVIIKGTIKHDEIFEWYDSIDIYIQSSLLEGLSRAVVEAMSRGLPCIAANKGGNPELIEKEYLFKIGRESNISNEICECIKKISSIDNMEQTASRNYLLSNSLFDQNTLNSKRVKFYSSFKEFICLRGTKNRHVSSN